jgi:RNA polymerase sigma-32 factor
VEELSEAEERRLVKGRVGEALAGLDPRERFIIERRVMSERPMTLKEVGDHFGFSRERARQLEIRAKEKLREGLRPLCAEIDWPGDGAPADGDAAA